MATAIAQAASVEDLAALGAREARVAAADRAALDRVASAVPSAAHSVAGVDGRNVAVLSRPAVVALAPAAVDALTVRAADNREALVVALAQLAGPAVATAAAWDPLEGLCVAPGGRTALHWPCAPHGCVRQTSWISQCSPA